MGSFWEGNHYLMPLAEKLDDLIPREGEIKGKANAKLERFRKLVNAYYRLHNDGDKSGYFRQLTEAQIEEKMATACIEACVEQLK